MKYEQLPPTRLATVVDEDASLPAIIALGIILGSVVVGLVWLLSAAWVSPK